LCVGLLSIDSIELFEKPGVDTRNCQMLWNSP
jgi:hypothetical protein